MSFLPIFFPIMWNRTVGTLLGAAVHAIRALTVAQLEQIAVNIHRRFLRDLAVLTPVAVPPLALNHVVSSPALRASALIAGALIGIGVAVLFVPRR